MLRGGHIGLSHADVSAKFVKEDSADVENDDYRHDQMSPVTMSVLGFDITPSKLIQARHSPVVAVLSAIHGRRALSTNAIERE